MPVIPDIFPLAELLDFLEDVMAWMKDREGRYVWVNRAMRVAYSLEHPEAGEAAMLGQTDYDLSPAFLADQFRHDDEQVLDGNHIVNRIERVGESEGSASWSITNKIPVRDAAGNITGTAGITRGLRGDHPPPGSGTPSNFGPVLALLRDHYGSTVTNERMAKAAGMSLRAFERQFLSSFHVTPQKYLRKLRLRVASRELIFTGKPLSELALDCGFGDQSHFTREFRQAFGRTPREYRGHYKTGPAAAVSGTKSAAPAQAKSPPRR